MLSASALFVCHWLEALFPKADGCYQRQLHIVMPLMAVSTINRVRATGPPPKQPYVDSWG
jgi:hypothetical protein